MATAPTRNFGLDALRCLAVAMVLANHALIFLVLPVAAVAYDGAVAGASLVSILSIEWLFVLSGFLIGTMMIRTFEREPTFARQARGFWLRRWFRTVPNYYLFLLVNVALVWAGIGEGDFDWRHAVFLQNLAWTEDVPFFFVEAWSLALDEWFYLLMPLLVGLFAWRRRLTVRTTFVLASLVLIAVPTLLRLLTAPPDPDYFGGLDAGRLFDWDRRIRRVTIMHLDGTGWGVLAAVLSRWSPGFLTQHRAAKALAGLALMGAGLAIVEQLFFGGWAVESLPRLSNAAGITLMASGTMLVLPALTHLDAPGLGRWSVEQVSTYSYSIYLSHLPVLLLLRHWLPGWSSPGELTALIVVWLVAVLAVSALTYHGFEKPISDLRERFTKRVDASPFGPATPP